MEELNTTVQKAQVISDTAKKHLKTADVNGITDSASQELAGSIADTTAKDVAQQKAIQHSQDMTAAQNTAMADASALIGRTQNAAKASYGEDNAQKMRRYHTGRGTIKTVKNMVSELGYTQSVATEDAADLIENGLTQADIDSFPAVTAAVIKTDTDQQEALKAQVKATDARNKSEQKLKRSMRRVINQAKSAFKKQPDVLAEFVPPPKPRAKRKAKTDTKSAATSTATSETKK
jgi:hypothetical protein